MTSGIKMAPSAILMSMSV